MMRLDELPTPALIVDLDRAQRNVDRMAAKARAAGIGLRPHFKTSKLLEIARMQREAGAIGMTCATAAEVVALQDDGVASILWGHQMVGPGKVALAVTGNQRGEVIVAVDSLDSATALAREAAAAGAEVPCVIELDTGLRRAGVLPADAAGLAVALRQLAGVRLVGVMTHEGHLQALVGDLAGLAAAANDAAAGVVAAARACAAAGATMDIVSVGSTPAAALVPFPPGITEARPGTYVFFDSNQVALGSATWDECAVSVLARVVSHNRPGSPVVDAGLKALSGDGAIQGTGHGWLPAEGGIVDQAFEEHGILAGGEVGGLAPGDLVRIVPNHVCGAMNMWSEAVAVRGDDVQATLRTVGRR